MCTFTHTCTHTHTHIHVHTHTPWAVSHSCITINALLLQFILFPNCRPTYIKLFLAVILFITCFSFVFLLEPYLFLNCLVYQCARLCMYTHTSTSIHLQLQSHVYCLCKFVFPCSGNYQQVFLLPFALLNIHECMHMHTHTHAHKPICTCNAHSCTHTQESCFNHKHVHMCT